MYHLFRHSARITPKQATLERISNHLLSPNPVVFDAGRNLYTRNCAEHDLERSCLRLSQCRTTPEHSYSRGTSYRDDSTWASFAMLTAAYGLGYLLFSGSSLSAREIEDISDGSPYERRSRDDLFFEACQKGNLDLIRHFVQEGYNVNERHKYGWTPLLVAVANNQPKLVEYLLTQGANPDAADEFSGAVKRGEDNFFYVEFDLLSTRHNFFPHFKETVCTGFSCLHYAASLDNLPIIKLLFAHGANGLAVNEAGLTASEMTKRADIAKTITDLQKQREQNRDPEVYKQAKLKEILSTELIGQHMAIDQVSSVVNRLETRWIDDKHPVVLLFVGGTGLGKTEMAKQLALYLRGDTKDSFIHINLSEYQSKHEAAKFIGAPPGYVGYGGGEDSQLLSLLTKNPKAIVLFDEADKAHPDVLATLLQLFDEGRLTSGSGKTVDCPEAIFILTANLAIDEIQKFSELLRTKEDNFQTPADDGVDSDKLVKEFTSRLLHGCIKEAFKRDELLGRINEVAIFTPFSPDERANIIEQQLTRVRLLAAAKHGISLSWEQDVLTSLATSISEKYGARNIKHEVDRQIVVRLNQAEEAGLFRPGDFVHVQVDHLIDCDDGNFVRIYKLSPSGSKENLSLTFAALEELYTVDHC